jgi:hypothetical protein
MIFSMRIRYLILAILFALPLALFTVPQPQLPDTQDNNLDVSSNGKHITMSTPQVELPPVTGHPIDLTKPPKNLEEAREKLRARLTILNKMTPESWIVEQTERLNARQQRLLDLQKEQEKEGPPPAHPTADGLPPLEPEKPVHQDGFPDLGPK